MDDRSSWILDHLHPVLLLQLLPVRRGPRVYNIFQIIYWCFFSFVNKKWNGSISHGCFNTARMQLNQQCMDARMEFVQPIPILRFPRCSKGAVRTSPKLHIKSISTSRLFAGYGMGYFLGTQGTQRSTQLLLYIPNQEDLQYS